MPDRQTGRMTEAKQPLPDLQERENSMIHFILGDSGTGKTEYVFRHMIEEAEKAPDRRFYLFVPEQNTLEAQKRFISMSERHGILNIDVLSFQLLAYRVMDELNCRKPELMDDMMKSMLLRKACEEVKSGINVYSRKLDSAGFIAQLKRLYSEFCQYGIGAEELEKAQDKVTSPLLKGKLKDVMLIFDRFRADIAEKAYMPEEVPQLLLGIISKSHLLDGADIYFDGYTGFTPVQLKLLEHIIPAAADCSFALTVPAEYAETETNDSDDITDLFRLSTETIKKLTVIAEKNNIFHGEDVLLKEKHCKPQLRIVRAADTVSEVRCICRRIRQLAVLSGEKSIRYRRIAVALSDPAGYKEIIKREFGHYAIPYFMDERASGSGDVSVRFILSTVKMIAEGYKYEDVLGFMKNPVITAGDEQKREYVDRLDNYIRSTGIRGRSRIEKMLSENEADAVCGFFAGAMNPVFKLQDQIKASEKIKDRIDALREYFAACGFNSMQEAYCTYLKESGFAIEAEESGRFFELIKEFLENMHSILGEEKVSLKTFYELLNAGLRELKAGVIPASMDTVVIGDLKRSRFDDIDVLFVAGANDGLLPQTVTGGGIFTDREREEIAGCSLELAPSDKEDSLIQSFYFYLLTGKPELELDITFAAESSDGKSMKPSAMIGELIEKNPGTGIENDNEDADACSLSDAYTQLSALLAAREPGSGRFAALLKAVSEREAEHTDGLLGSHSNGLSDGLSGRLVKNAFMAHTSDSISAETAVRLYGDIISGSVTRIEQFEKCPFAHFLSYGLRLEERKLYSFEAMDVGILYHRVIDLVMKMLEHSGRTLRDIGYAELSEMTAAVVESEAEEYNGRILHSTAGNIYLKEQLKRVSVRTMKTLKQHYEKGSFDKTRNEYSFTVKDTGCEFKGRIDRMDTMSKDETAYVRVIDYKSGGTTFKRDLVMAGRQLQLCMYMDSALKEALAETGISRAVPAGMFYYNIKDPMADAGKIDETAAEGSSSAETAGAADAVADIISAELCMNGLVNSDPEVLKAMDCDLNGEATVKSKVIPVGIKVGSAAVSIDDKNTASEEEFLELIEHTKQIIRRDAGRISSGDINIAPVKEGANPSCNYCLYRSVCRFDPRLEGYNYRV